MSLSKEEIKWLKKTINNDEYQISVDNDCVFISTYDPDTDDWECVFTFDSYGQDFIIQLLNYMGCDASGV